MVRGLSEQVMHRLRTVPRPDMKEQFVYDPLISKRQQYLLATQLVRAVLKIGGCI